MGTAEVHGRLWGARVRDYACLTEGAFRPLFDAVFDVVAVGDGTRLLDVGCGAGLATLVAARRGAIVAGLDASERSLEVAHERVPDGDFRAGEMEELPWPDHSFDVVTGFNAFQFAADPVNALRQARRVATPAGRVVMAFWGREDDCEIRWVIDALGAILPPPPPDAENAFALADPGRVERLMSQAGLTPIDGGEAECAFAYRDHPTAMRGMLSAGPFVAADELLGPEPVRRVVSDALERFRTGDGSYCIRNRIRYVVASA